MSWDVIVIGAGPAGCAAAAAVQSARPAARVLVLDRSEFPRDKTCGDGIAFEAREALERLGFDVGAVFEGAPPVTRLRLRSPGGVETEQAMPERVHVVPRRIFDGRLVDDLRGRGIPLRRQEVRSVRPVADGVEVDGSLSARVVIGADGAESVTRRGLGIEAARGRHLALAIRGYGPEVPGQHGEQFIAMSGQHWPAYAWSFPIGGGRANIGYGHLLGAGPVNRAGMIERLRELLPGVEPDLSGLRAHRLPLSSGRPAIRDGRILLTGDAQSLINPLSGEGIFYAITSGALAGAAAVRALEDGRDPGRTYRALMAARLGRHLRHTSALARLSRWPGLVDAGTRAAASDQGAFDDLIRFSLADGLLTPRLVRSLRWR
jgi:geranylgeranyl reductase family protein